MLIEKSSDALANRVLLLLKKAIERTIPPQVMDCDKSLKAVGAVLKNLIVLSLDEVAN